MNHKKELEKYIKKEVLDDIDDLLKKENLEYWKGFIEEEEEEEEGYITLTLAFNDTFDTWDFQTGDNSYTGNAYGLKNWIVIRMTKDTTKEDIFEDTYFQIISI